MSKEKEEPIYCFNCNKRVYKFEYALINTVVGIVPCCSNCLTKEFLDRNTKEMKIKFYRR